MLDTRFSYKSKRPTATIFRRSRIRRCQLSGRFDEVPTKRPVRQEANSDGRFDKGTTQQPLRGSVNSAAADLASSRTGRWIGTFLFRTDNFYFHLSYAVYCTRLLSFGCICLTADAFYAHTINISIVSEVANPPSEYFKKSKITPCQSRHSNTFNRIMFHWFPQDTCIALGDQETESYRCALHENRQYRA